MTSQEEHDQPPLSSVSVSNGSALSNGVNGNVNQAFETKDEPNFLTWDCRYSGTNRSSYKCHIKHTCEILGTDNCKRCLLESNLQGLYDRNYNSIVGKGRGDDACVLSLRSHLLTELTGSGKGSGHRKKSSSAPSSIRLPKQKQKSKISKCQGSSDTWKINLDQFKSGRKILESEKDLPKSLRSFYKQQAALIDSYESLSRDSQSCDGRNAADLLKKATFYSKLTFFVNLFLLIAKSIAAGISGSMAIITSLVDSVVDLASGIVLWVTARTIRKGNLYSYPQGRSRLEPLAIIVLSVIMGVASLQLIKESVTKIIGLSDRSMKPPVVDAITIVISITTVVVKFVLFLVCRRIKSPTIQALAQDHRNDVISNTLAILCGYIGSEEIRQQTKNINLAYVDPVGAILISLYIAVTWYILGRIQVRIITGLTAKPEFLSKIIWICLNHHRDIRYVTSVKAVHSGYTFVVEVGILLPEDMSLKAAHTIGESLEKVLENTQHVDRVFVHMNCTENDNPTFY
ncbi:metal tolerance protein 11-like isoform X3 [Pecten maximus]|uniref:metal tolerance protein 11-like isoform X2 n=1 Tax=Pecten maximus TaxID=6579 RepID=UPI001458D703|nr:metal tolerance protein 11-like isoform X2 [Pecten maximus]XP_033764125.1 metal tolerance protein 11-like isoform X3 [Pecten maximus]